MVGDRSLTAVRPYRRRTVHAARASSADRRAQSGWQPVGNRPIIIINYRIPHHQSNIHRTCCHTRCRRTARSAAAAADGGASAGGRPWPDRTC